MCSASGRWARRRRCIPKGTGRWVRKGQMLRTNLHYHPNGTPQVDRTRVGLYFGKGEMKKEVAAALAGNITFSIPPNAPNFEMRSVYMVDQDINIVSFFPHMHLRGKDMKMTATFPDGAAADAAERAGVRLQLAAVLLPEDEGAAAARHARRSRRALRQLRGATSTTRIRPRPSRLAKRRRPPR